MKELAGHPNPMHERGDGSASSRGLTPLPAALPRSTHRALVVETTCSACQDDAKSGLGYRLVLRCTTGA